MNIFVHPLHAIGVLAPVVTARCGHFDVLFSEFGEGIKTAQLPDKWKIAAVGEMVQERNSLEGINACHTVGPLVGLRSHYQYEA
jgi:hypothetical protein